MRRDFLEGFIIKISFRVHFFFFFSILECDSIREFFSFRRDVFTINRNVLVLEVMNGQVDLKLLKSHT